MLLLDNPISNFGLATLVLGPKGESVVRVVYSDESGVGSEHDEPITVVVGLMLNMDSQWHPVLELIESALFEYKGEKNPPNYEIKGRDLYHRIKKGDAQAANFMKMLMSIPSLCYVPIFHGAVHREGHRRFVDNVLPPRSGSREWPKGSEVTFNIAFTTCMIQVETYVHTVFPKEQVLWIHDRGKYDERAKRHLKNLRHRIDNDSLKEKEQLFKNNPYPAKSQIVDTVYFGKSEESRAIQLADICCSTIARHLQGDPVAAPYYQLLSQQIIGHKEIMFDAIESYRKMEDFLKDQEAMLVQVENFLAEAKIDGSFPTYFKSALENLEVSTVAYRELINREKSALLKKGDQ